MRIEYISHACLSIRTKDNLMATDPWLGDACYARQWNLFPRPVDTSQVEKADTILISHAHADHLHEPTLTGLPSGKTVYYPYYWYAGTLDWLAHMGFANAVEARSGQTCQLGAETRVTYLVCGQDAIMVIEEGDVVLVNINDALHSASDATIRLYCSRILELWPKIDYVFCGFGGASYYPNVFHSPEKDDRAIGRLREEYFVAAFCRIVAALKPRIAVPFAADFVLLNPRQRWMNEIRFPREQMPAYFDAHYRTADMATRVITMYPGDVLEGEELHAISPYREKMRNGTLDHLIDEQYPREISVFASGQRIDASEADRVVDLLTPHINTQAALRPREKVEGLHFAVQLTDVASPNWYEVRIHGGDANVSRVQQPDVGVSARVRTSHGALLNSIKHDWGGDDIIIGYGCEVEAASSADMRRARLASELLVRHPDPRLYARRHPLRMMRYVAQTWFSSRARIAAKLQRRQSDDDMVKSDMWLTEEADVLRSRLGLPGTS